MSKFAANPTPTRSPINTARDAIPSIQTFEGHAAYTRTPKSELFLHAVTNMVAEKAFYETAGQRDSRFRNLLAQVTISHPHWMQQFIPWLRNDAFMRSATVVALAEYVANKGPNARGLIANTLRRADEPAELLAYWLNSYSRQLPASLKRGIADAATNLYSEYSVLKYDSEKRAVRMADVLNLTHPKPLTPKQEALFKYILDRRYGNAADIPPILNVIHSRARLNALPRDKITLDMLPEAGATWEWWSSKGEMDAAAWEFVIPQMGYMATLRNLRNFDQAGISPVAQSMVRGLISDPSAVAKSMQFPYRFYSAYKATGSLTYARELEEALELSTSNIPSLPGRTLVLTDVSGSMGHAFSRDSSVQYWEVGALFAGALARRSEDVDLVAWATESRVVPVKPSVLRTIEEVQKAAKGAGGGTNLHQALDNFNGHDRVVVFTDMQIAQIGRGWFDTGTSVNIETKLDNLGVPVYFFNVAGYSPTPVQVGTGLIHEFGGFSDASFKMMPLMESTTWPWEQDNFAMASD